MRRSVAACAGRYEPVFVFVTEHTAQLGMFGTDADECIVYGLVTRSTEVRGHVLTICDRPRLVRRVARKTVFVSHVGRMRLMALQARRYLPVLLVAGRAEKL